jgi:MFS family permease
VKVYSPRYNKKEWLALLLAAVSAFCVYTCMYAFRKPFTAATYSDHSFLNIDCKVWLVVAQTVGYTLSKFYGIRFIGELKTEKRFSIILSFIGTAWIALLFFALTPPPFNIIFLLINGFPLGVIYGIVFSYLEGRRSTELLGAVLAASFIFASGFTQSAGKWLMVDYGLSQWWMPFATGTLFILPTVFFTWLLNKTPPPTAEDVALRTERKPMNREERKAFLQTFLPGLILLITGYVILTIVRDYRSNFAANIWIELGKGNDTSIFTKTEIPASVVTLFLMGMLVFVKKNIHALLLNHLIIIVGLLLCIASTLFYTNGLLSPFWWMTWLGVGLYMGYVPFNCMLFDRLIATFRYVSNAGFIIYVADSFGYLGSDVVLVMKNFMKVNLSWTEFFIRIILACSSLGIVVTAVAAFYFKRKYSVQKPENINLKYV